MRRFFDLLSEGTGLYNIGWLPEAGGEFHDGQRRLVEKVVTPLKKQSGLVVEAGSGQGGPALVAKEVISGRIIGLELLRDQIEAATRLGGTTTQFVRGDACQTPFGNSTISGVYCIESAFHYPDKSAFVREVARVLKPGGIFSLADMMRKSSGAKIPARMVARSFGSPGFYTRQEYQVLAAEAGLEMIHCEDLTPGVARSVKCATIRISAEWKSLRRDYPYWMLATFIVTGRLLPIIHQIGPVEYRWLVFKKPL